MLFGERQEYLDSIGVRYVHLCSNFSFGALDKPERLSLRSEMLKQVVNEVRNGKPVRICGQHGMGKTSMFSQVAESLGLDAFYLNLYLIKSIKSDEAIRELRKFFEQKNVKHEVMDDDVLACPDGVLGCLNDVCTRENLTMIVGLDELFGLDRASLGSLVKAAKRLKSLRFVFLDHPISDDQYRNQLFGKMPTFYLPPLSQEEAARLIRHSLAATNLTITDEAMMVLYDLTAGRPCEIVAVLNMLFCDNFWNVFWEERAFQQFFENKEITANSLSAIKDEIACHCFTNEQIFIYSVKFGANFKKLSPKEACLLLRLADGGPPLKSQKPQVKTLERLGLIIRDDGYWCINGQLLEEVLSFILKDQSYMDYYFGREIVRKFF